MYSGCCVSFLHRKPLVKNTFFNPFPKNAEVVNLKNPNLDLIRSILLECGYFGFMIRFRIFPKNAPRVFQILFQKKNPKVVNLKNLELVWILWIHDHFLDFVKRTQNPFSDFTKKTHRQFAFHGTTVFRLGRRVIRQ